MALSLPLAFLQLRRGKGDAGKDLCTLDCRTALRPRWVPTCNEKNKAKQPLAKLPVTPPVAHSVRVNSIGGDLKYHSAPNFSNLLWGVLPQQEKNGRCKDSTRSA